MGIRVEKVCQSARKQKPQVSENQLGFGKYFTDHMFIMNYSDGAWRDPRIVPYQPLNLDPAAMCLHYGQMIFEGMKAYRGAGDGIYLFRPGQNMKRMNNSAAKVCMPAFDGQLVMEAIRKLVLLDADWIPKTRGTSLYIRPTMIADEPALGVRPSGTYIFYVIIGPVAAYYPEGFNPVRIYVSDQHVRAAVGGLGEAKTAANYAASLYAAEAAKKAGYTQVLWLDAVSRSKVEEVGTMNIFFLTGKGLVTPPLKGTILPGVTRDSVIRAAADLGVKVFEEDIGIDEVMDGAASGAIKEIFGTGTAAVISPVGEIFHRGRTVKVGGGVTGELSHKLYDMLLSIQLGEIPDPYGWVERIN